MRAKERHLFISRNDDALAAGRSAFTQDRAYIQRLVDIDDVGASK